MHERTVLLPDRVLDTERGAVLAGRAVVIEGDRIAAVLAPEDVPEGPARIDLAGHTLLPGLMDMHSHLIGLQDSGQGYAALIKRSGAQEALTGVPNARATLRGGVHHGPRRRLVPRLRRRGACVRRSTPGGSPAPGCCARERT